MLELGAPSCRAACRRRAGGTAGKRLGGRTVGAPRHLAAAICFEQPNAPAALGLAARGLPADGRGYGAHLKVSEVSAT